MSWFRRHGKQPPVEVRHIEREVCRLTVGEWRADRGFVATAAGVLNDTRVKHMLDCLNNSSPGQEVLPLGAGPQERIVQQARQEGYVMALANFAALGRESSPPEPVESVFETPDQQAGGPAAMGG